MELKQNVMYKVVRSNKNSELKKGDGISINMEGNLMNWSWPKKIPPNLINTYLDGVEIIVDFEYAKNEIKRHREEIDSIVERYGMILSDD